MATFTQLSASYFAIQRTDGKTQVLIFSAAKLQEFADTIKCCLTDSLDRLADLTLPDADYKVGSVLFKVSSLPETGTIRTDIREWYTDSITQTLKPTKKGVNLSLEQLTVVESKIADFITREKEVLTRLTLVSTQTVATNTDFSPETPTPKALTNKRKLTATKLRLKTGLKKKVVTPKKAKKGSLTNPIVVESDHETIEIVSSSDEELDSD